MIMQRVIRSAIILSALGLIGLGVLLTDTQTSFANCGGHCQAGHMCGGMVEQKGIKDKNQRRTEFQKCMRDPQNYK